jgi:hypothetical protein
LLYEDYFVGADGFENAISNSRLPRTGSATDAYDHEFGLWSLVFELWSLAKVKDQRPKPKIKLEY